MDTDNPYTGQNYPQQPETYPAPSGYMPPVQQYQVGFGEAIARGFSNYVNFLGRASRSEFWWWYLFYFMLIIIPLGMMLAGTFSASADVIGLIGTVCYYIISIGLFLPTMSMVWRRLHDIGRSGAWVLLTLIPFVNIVVGILLIVWYCQPSKPFENEYGPVPNLKTT